MRLIEDIYEKAMVEYISDLHQVRHWKKILSALYLLSENEYLADEWTKAYQYITGDLEQPVNAREELMERLKNSI